MSAIGGLPFCHGSGGVTAHVKGGANHWSSNLVVGCVLLLISLIQLAGDHVVLNFPVVLLSSLLVATGVFHLGLAGPSWAQKSKRFTLSAMALTAIFTFNMFWVLIAGIISELLLGKVPVFKKMQVES